MTQPMDNPYEFLKDADYISDQTLTEWAMSSKGRAFMARAEVRQDLRELGRRSDLDIMKAVMVVSS